MMRSSKGTYGRGRAGGETQPGNGVLQEGEHVLHPDLTKAPEAGPHVTHSADEEREAQGSEGGPTGVQEDQR